MIEQLENDRLEMLIRIGKNDGRLLENSRISLKFVFFIFHFRFFFFHGKTHSLSHLR